MRAIACAAQVAFFFQYMAFHAVAAESLDDLQAIVSVAQTRSYSDISRLDASMQVAPMVTIQNPPGRDISKFIQQEYGVTAADSGRAYDLLESTLLKMNGLSAPEQFSAGKILAPDLPPLTGKKSPPNVAFAAIESNISKYASRSGEPQAYQGRIKIRNTDKDSVNFRRIDIYPAADGIAVAKKARGLAVPVSVGMEVGLQLADTGQKCDAATFRVLHENESALIRNALSTAARSKERYLIVLDTGWPTFAEQEASLRRLRRLFDEIRFAIHIKKSDLSSFAGDIAAADFKEPGHPHACMIMRSLQEFRALDENNLIKIVFVPLRPGQSQSKQLFKEIIELNQIINMLGSDLFARTPTKPEMESAKAFADRAMQSTGMPGLKALTEPWSANDDVVRIYEPLVSGLIRLLHTYSQIDPVTVPGHVAVDARFWVSLSWNLTKFAAAPSLVLSPSYMVFVAAGNDKSDFVRGQRLFASEAINNRRVVAVMNSDERSGALTCGSAIFEGLWKDENSDKTIVSFPGRLSPENGAPCPGPGGGTSFSAPRLAWLAALVELMHPMDRASWIPQMSSRLMQSRIRVAADPDAAPISIEKFFFPSKEVSK